jgi:hypothetical protein
MVKATQAHQSVNNSLEPIGRICIERLFRWILACAGMTVERWDVGEGRLFEIPEMRRVVCGK